MAAADFDELLRYGYGRNPSKRRELFTRLVRDAHSDEDLDLLAKILAVLYMQPAESNLALGWFFHRLRRGDDEFDAERAAKILNRVYEIHYRAGMLMVLTLRGFVDTYENETRLLDAMEATGLLTRDVMRHVKDPSPKVFLSYAREDSTRAERLYIDLRNVGFEVWKDSHELLPGERWETRIRKAFQWNEFAVLCLSTASVRKRGFFQMEIKLADRIQRERSSDDVYILPVQFDEVPIGDIPDELRDLHYVSLASDWTEGVSRIADSILKYHRTE
ncbi:MAG: toll/interleukin-1 receptor domain-containing protein [Pseudonocardia sp.]